MKRVYKLNAKIKKKKYEKKQQPTNTLYTDTRKQNKDRHIITNGKLSNIDMSGRKLDCMLPENFCKMYQNKVQKQEKNTKQIA